MRSLLFVPADSERKIEKAPRLRRRRGDPRPRGFGRRATTRTCRAEPRRRIHRRATAGAPGPRLYVRINPLASGLAEVDLDAIVAGAAGRRSCCPRPKAAPTSCSSPPCSPPARRSPASMTAPSASSPSPPRPPAALFDLGSYARRERPPRRPHLGRRGSVRRARRRGEPRRRRRASPIPTASPAPSDLAGAAAAGVDADRHGLRQLSATANALRGGSARPPAATASAASSRSTPTRCAVINRVFTPSAEAIGRARAVRRRLRRNPAPASSASTARCSTARISSRRRR